MRNLFLLVASMAIIYSAPSEAQCLAGQTLFARAWSITPSTNESVHFQLWNKGTAPLTLLWWNAQSFTASNVGISAGPTGNGDPNQNPLDGTRQRLVSDITAFGASFANGVNGNATGLPTQPADALSMHGEMRAQVSTTEWLLAQAWNAFANQTTAVVEATRGWVIPPGKGFTVRSGTLRADLRVSFVWCEPTP